MENKEREEMLLSFLGEESYRPMKFRQLCGVLGVGRQDRQDFSLLLDRLIHEKKLTLTGEQTYMLPRPDTVEGTFSANARGFGFVRVPDQEKDIFISPDDTQGAFDGDRVQVQILGWNDGPGSGSRNPEGRVRKILERSFQTMTGIYQKSKYFGFVVPDNQKIGRDIFIPKAKNAGAVQGSRVVVRILDYGNASRKPEGEIIRILGMADDARCDAAVVAEAYGLRQEFPSQVLQEADSLPQEVPAEEICRRRDLRHLLTVTIDGEDARDLDDAISLVRKDTGWQLGVHIADVSHYVREGSALDQEARRRGTSVYLIDTVLPMLPRALSNGICSLNEGVDRLSLTCLMDLDAAGKVTGHEICESVIRVDHRMSYTQVGSILKGEDTYTGSYADCLQLFGDMKELSDLIRRRRQERGGIDFDFPESDIRLGEDGVPVSIGPYQINDANRIIEDFMLLANETIAQDHYWQETPFVYRSHETPDPDKTDRLYQLIQSFGYSIHTRNRQIHPMEFQKLLGRLEGKPEASFLSRMVLRSMKRAAYTTENLGHFGLAASYYCHFTSPIRRYPDLQIHRIIKENLHGRLDESRKSHYRDILPDVARDSSAAERKADDAERALDKIKKAEFLSRHIGEEYDGIISGISSWGFYAELENTCEGLVRMEELGDDYYVFDQRNEQLEGLDTGKIWRIGDRVRVRVLRADPASRIVFFTLV